MEGKSCLMQQQIINTTRRFCCIEMWCADCTPTTRVCLLCRFNYDESAPVHAYSRRVCIKMHLRGRNVCVREHALFAGCCWKYNTGVHLHNKCSPPPAQQVANIEGLRWAPSPPPLHYPFNDKLDCKCALGCVRARWWDTNTPGCCLSRHLINMRIKNPNAARCTLRCAQIASANAPRSALIVGKCILCTWVCSRRFPAHNCLEIII